MMRRDVVLALIMCCGMAACAQKTITEPKFVLPGETADIDVMTISPTGSIATGSADKTVKIYSADSPFKLVKTLAWSIYPVTAMKFSRDGKLLATSTSDFNIRIWDSVYKVFKSFDGHTAKVNCMLFDAARKYLCSGADDGKILIWDLATGKMLRTMDFGRPVYAMAQTSDPRNLYVAGSDPVIKIFSMVNGLPSKTVLNGHT